MYLLIQWLKGTLRNEHISACITDPFVNVIGGIRFFVRLMAVRSKLDWCYFFE